MRRIVAWYSAGPGTGERWTRMARVFAHSARVHCPEWELSLTKGQAIPPHRTASNKQYGNTLKLDAWCEAVASAADGDELLLIDVDTVILKPLDDVWAQAFDVAYTARPKGWPHPLNGGVVFVRVTARAREFMRVWGETNRQMLTDRRLFHRFRHYAGMNQRAFGAMLESPAPPSARLLALPCLEWNCEDSTWAHFDPSVTRILHVKDQVQHAIELQGGFGPKIRHLVPSSKPHIAPLARLWMTAAKQAEEARVGV